MRKKRGRERPNLSAILESKANLRDRFIPDHGVLDSTIKKLKQKGLRIVLTQGVYDLLHEGHAKYLEAAKSYGDILVVGVDSDEFTRTRKGPNRPVVPERERVKMLAHLRHVDIVTIREVHHDIGDLIRLIKPHVLVTSSSTKDFTAKMKKDYAAFCEKIVTLPPQATTTTTARIRNLTIGGAEELANQVYKITQTFLKNIGKS